MIPGGTAIDMYGDGGVVTELEQEVAALLGKPAAVFLPSGLMAQQIVLRVYLTAGAVARCCSTRPAMWTCTRTRGTSGCTA